MKQKDIYDDFKLKKTVVLPLVNWYVKQSCRFEGLGTLEFKGLADNKDRKRYAGIFNDCMLYSYAWVTALLLTNDPIKMETAFAIFWR